MFETVIDLNRIVPKELARGYCYAIIGNKTFDVVVDDGIAIHGHTDISNGLSVQQFRNCNLPHIIILAAVPLEMFFKYLPYLMLQVGTNVRFMSKRIVDNLVITAISVFLKFIDVWPAIGESVTLTNALIDRFDKQTLAVTQAIKLTCTICQVENTVEWFHIVEAAPGIVDTGILVIAY